MVVSHHRLAGPAADIQRIQEVRVEETVEKTLGLMVNRFLAEVMVPEAQPQKSANADSQHVTIDFHASNALSPADAARTIDDLKDLVAMRNTLVHNLRDEYDLWQPAGRESARTYLNACYERVDAHYEQLRIWASAIDMARRCAAEMFQALEMQDWLCHGIAPDGTVDWARAGCLKALRDAEQKHAIDGRTSLPTAAEWITTHHPKQTPEKYGCQSWAHVLNETRQFELTYRYEAGHRVAWLRISAQRDHPFRHRDQAFRSS